MFEVKRFAWVFAMLTTVACGGAGDDAAESGESDEIESALHGGERYSYRGYWARGLEREAGRVVFVREGGLPVFGPNDFLQDSMAASVIAFRAPATLGGGVRVIHADMKCYNQYDPSVTCRVYADDQYGEHWYFDFHRNVDGRPDLLTVSSGGAETFSTTYGPAAPSQSNSDGALTLGGTRSG